MKYYIGNSSMLVKYFIEMFEVFFLIPSILERVEQICVFNNIRWLKDMVGRWKCSLHFTIIMILFVRYQEQS